MVDIGDLHRCTSDKRVSKSDALTHALHTVTESSMCDSTAVCNEISTARTVAGSNWYRATEVSQVTRYRDAEKSPIEYEEKKRRKKEKPHRRSVSFHRLVSTYHNYSRQHPDSPFQHFMHLFAGKLSHDQDLSIPPYFER